MILSGCSTAFEGLPKSKNSQIGVFSQLDSTLTFYDEELSELTKWKFEEPYTGMYGVTENLVLLFGYGMNEAHLYDVTTGEIVASYSSGDGVVSAVSDQNHIYLANSKTNQVTQFSLQGNELQTIRTGNYPMSMMIADQRLMVVNYQDIHVSVIDLEEWQVVNEWKIPKASQGIHMDEQFLYIGGHGSRAVVNHAVTILDRQTGEIMTSLDLPLMPIDFTTLDNSVYVISHGSNTLFRIENNEIKESMSIAANPFVVEATNESLFVAGYDDDTLYKVENMAIVAKTSTGNGPLQIFVREGQK